MAKIPYTYRSRLNELPLEMKIKLAELPYQKGMLPSSRKNKAFEILREYNIDFIELGTGTNRFIVKYDGYALKIALDKEGIADNKQEYAICNALGPDAAPAFDISKGGQFLVSKYCPAFTSYVEMTNYRTEIIKILNSWKDRFLLGDVSISRKTYANWGLDGDRPVCIDYAYLFPASMELFTCICGELHMDFTDDSFTTYKCIACGRTYDDGDLRQRITQEERFKLLANVTDKSIEMTEPTKTIEIEKSLIKSRFNPDGSDEF